MLPTRANGQPTLVGTFEHGWIAHLGRSGCRQQLLLFQWAALRQMAVSTALGVEWLVFLYTVGEEDDGGDPKHPRQALNKGGSEDGRPAGAGTGGGYRSGQFRCQCRYSSACAGAGGRAHVAGVGVPAFGTPPLHTLQKGGSHSVACIMAVGYFLNCFFHNSLF